MQCITSAYCCSLPHRTVGSSSGQNTVTPAHCVVVKGHVRPTSTRLSPWSPMLSKTTLDAATKDVDWVGVTDRDDDCDCVTGLRVCEAVKLEDSETVRV